MTYKQFTAYLLAAMTLIGLTGCMTVGYSTARDPNMVAKFDVTITEIEPQNIYNALGVALVGPFASVEHRGQKITFLDAKGNKVSIVQPISNRYELHLADKAVYIVDRGQVWVQPKDYPLPPEFAQFEQTRPQIQPPPTPVVDIKAAPPAPDPAPAVHALEPTKNNAVAGTAPSKDADAVRLEKLKALRDRGAITQEDYNKKKQAILDAM